MRRIVTLSFALILATATACSDDPPDEPANVPVDVEDPNADAPDAEEPDSGESLDVGDAAAPTQVTARDAAAGPIRVGVGRRRMPVPLGIGTVGFASFVPEDGVDSRYAADFAATIGIYTHPSLHAVAVEGPEQTVVFLRTDTIAVGLEIRDEIVRRVVERGGPDLHDGLVLAATHTHSGPGRMVKHIIVEAGFDRFFPAFWDRLLDTCADAVMDAIGDLEPGRIGHTIAHTDALHSDRRCESPDRLDGAMPVLRLDRADGTVKAIVMSYSLHGVVINNDTRLLSRDIHGGIEQKIEEQFDHPVTALFFNSWSGDTTYQAPPVEAHLGISSDFNRIEAAGNLAAEFVTDVLAGITTSDEAAVRGQVVTVPMDRERMGYEDEWNFPDGGAYCGIGLDAVCWGEGDPPDPSVLTSSCLPLPPDPPLNVTMVGMIRVGDLWLAMLPGEPGTEIGQVATGSIRDGLGLSDVGLIGYAHDYVGYSLTEADWYRGGYEAAGALWGPKQGDYINQHLIELAGNFVDGETLTWEPPETRPAYVVEDTSWTPEASAQPPAIAVQPPDNVTAPGIVEVVVHAGDPWFLAPRVVVEEQGSDQTFAPVRRKNGSAMGSDGYEIELGLAVDPPYEDVEGPEARTFAWTVRLPTQRPAASTSPSLVGKTLRLRISGETEPHGAFELTSNVFTVNN